MRYIVLLALLVPLLILTSAKLATSPELEEIEPPAPVLTVPVPEPSPTGTGARQYLCVSKLEGWPVGKVIKMWNNKMGLTHLVFKHDNCAGRVNLIEKVLPVENGMTRAGDTFFTKENVVKIRLHPAVPDSYRPSVLCHELGHALGLGHSADRWSCMHDPIPLRSKPTNVDLASIEYWDWHSASLSATM